MHCVLQDMDSSGEAPRAFPTTKGGARSRHLNSSSQHLFRVQSRDVVFVKTQLALIYSAVVLPQTRCRSEYRRNAVRKSRKDSRKSHALSQKLGSAPKLAVF